MNPASGIDLHSHSSASDGVLSPEQWAQLAKANGAARVALTDHDTVAGIAAARRATAALEVAFVAGVEISASYAGETIHVVGLGIDETDPVLLAGLAAVRSGRLRRAQAIAEALAAYGFPGAWEGALALAGAPDLISRSHFARFLVATGRFPTVADVFAHYLAKGKPGYVSHEWATLTDAVSWIRTAGGVAVLAHPGRYRLSQERLLKLVEDFIAAGGEAIEVVTSAHDAAATHYWATICRRYRLLASQGSDFHAPAESIWGLGRLGATLSEDLTPVWTRL